MIVKNKTIIGLKSIFMTLINTEKKHVKNKTIIGLKYMILITIMFKEFC